MPPEPGNGSEGTTYERDLDRDVFVLEDDPRDFAEIAQAIVRKTPIEQEPKNPTLDGPVIIECACPGWQPKTWPARDAYLGEPPEIYTEQGDVRYPAVPCSLEEQAEEVITAAEAGCAGSHIHPRDPDLECFNPEESMDLLSEIYDRIRDEVDVVPIQHAWTRTDDGGIDYISPAKKHLEAAGGSNKYIEAGLVLWPPGHSYPNKHRQAAWDGVEFYEANGIRPVHKVRSTFNARKFHQDIVQTGKYGEEPLVLVHDMGHPRGWPMDHATWSPVEMISVIEQSRERFPDDTVIGVYAGHRNWMLVTMLAIMLGVDMIRVGIEDLFYMYPHKDEVVGSNIECVNKVIDFCDIVGREIASPAQAREMLNIERT